MMMMMMEQRVYKGFGNFLKHGQGNGKGQQGERDGTQREAGLLFVGYHSKRNK